MNTSLLFHDSGEETRLSARQGLYSSDRRVQLSRTVPDYKSRTVKLLGTVHNYRRRCLAAWGSSDLHLS